MENYANENSNREDSREDCNEVCPDFDEKQHREELYQESLKGLAESVLRKEASARQEAEALVEIATKFDTKLDAVKRDHKRVSQELKLEYKKPACGNQQPFECSAEAKDRAAQIWTCPDKARVFHSDFNAVGYKADPLKTMFALLVFGVRFMNLRTWGAAHNLMCGTIFGVTGPSGAGKSTFVRTIEKFVDYSEAKQQGRIEEISDCSDHYLAFAGGNDGTGLSNKLICWEEMNSPGPTGFTIKMQIIWQTATKGYYIRKSSVARDSAGKREAIFYMLLGTLHHIFTTTDPAVDFELQFRNRTVFLDLHNSDEDRFEIHQLKLKRQTGSDSFMKQQRILYESWNYFEQLEEFRRLDPDDLESFADVDTTVLRNLIDSSDQGKLHDDDARRVDILIVLVAAHALLNQKHRDKTQDADGRWILYAAAEDFNAVLPVFHQCVLSDRKPQGKAHQDAFYQLVPKLVEGSLCKQEIQHVLGKAERTAEGYLKEWKHANVIEEDHRRYILGPAIKGLLSASDSGNTEVVRKAASQVFQTKVGFQPNALPIERSEPCMCDLHTCAESQNEG